MNRRTLLHRTGLLGLAAGWGGWSLTSSASEPNARLGTLKRPAAYWRDKVSPAAWRVLFEEDTEPAGSSPLDRERRSGVYVCAACYLPLFDSRMKYDSGTGWPSFFQARAQALGTREDRRFFMRRTEYHCRRCGGHQGHVFEDGPQPTGLRYCNNGLALVFIPAGQTLFQLRG